VSTAEELFQRATDVRADAVSHLTALAGDASMCAIGRSGRSFPAAKYHEGRQSGAGDVRRALRRWSADGALADAVVADVRQRWQQTLDGAQAKGPDWVAYATGGLDALAEITAALRPTHPQQ